MAALKDLAVSRGTLLNFDPALIHIKDGLNARDLSAPDVEEHIQFLMASIRENGFRQNCPLEIFQENDVVYVADGHCRLTALKRLMEEGLTIPSVPCIPETKGVNDVDRILRQNTSNSGKRLTMVEEGYNVKRALNLGLTQPEVARRIGKSLSYVTQLLDFQEAPAEVHQLVREGKVSSTFAAETMRERPEDGAEILKDAVAKAQAEGKDRATKKHSVLHQPKPKPEPQIPNGGSHGAEDDGFGEMDDDEGGLPAPAPAPVKHATAKPGYNRDEVKLLLSLCRDALDGVDDELSDRCEKLLRNMGG